MTHDITPDLDDLPYAPPPRATRQVFGHDEVFAQFSQQFAAGTNHHAWLLAGAQGIGKATLAYQIACHVLGQGGRQQIEAHAHPNLFVLKRGLNDKGTPNSVITVENVRDLNDFLHTTRVMPGWRVVLIDAIDTLNRNATNALLKTLEEPPAQTLFLLVCHSLGKLLPTIRSRVVVSKLHLLNSYDLEQAILNAMPEAAQEHRAQALSLSQGNARKACQLLHGQGGALIQAVGREFQAADWPIPDTFKLLEQISAKNATVEWQLLQDAILNMLHTHAHAAQTPLAQLNAIAAMYSEVETQFAEADEYNLDKQGVAFAILHKARSVVA